ncbi:MAG: cyclic nucleotide-binding domain-containing protein [Simplicispira sp.]|nr:cyclic nucleotide-binding domain-containing protein [Simplicispira sp.]
MRGLLALLRLQSQPSKAVPEPGDSVFFASAFADQGAEPAVLVPWQARAAEVGARRMPVNRGGKLLQALWGKDKYMAHLQSDAVQRMEQFFEFVQVPPQRDVIRQNEYGNFMVVVLTGTLAVDRLQPRGEQLRLAETRPGDILGEMSLLDSGIRLSSCTTLTDCEIAVLSADALDDMLGKDAQLAASFVALLARKLSLRLRAVSARLSENQK